ncbi:MAG: alpha/beta fold hydrolase, partial [Gammaproteobacteria bacterium]
GTFSVALFRRELAALRREMGLDEVVLVGQSWGCMLALEHVLEGAEGVRGLVLMSGLASIEEWNAETLRLRSELPPGVLAVLEAEEAAGRVGSPAFKEAYAVWEHRHVLRLDDPPPWEAEALALFQNDSRVYQLTTGGAEFPTDGGQGELQHWDVRPRLHELRVPTLLLSGRFDEATPAVMSTLHRGIAGSEWHVLEDSSHSCHSEQEALTMLLVADFLARTETGTA